MRRMVTSKQIEAINKIKVNDDEVLIESSPDASYIQMTDDAITIYNEGSDGISTYSDQDTVIEAGNDLKLTASNRIVISGLPNSDPHANGALWNDNGTLKISSGN